MLFIVFEIHFPYVSILAHIREKYLSRQSGTEIQGKSGESILGEILANRFVRIQVDSYQI